jgi:hypothetical protein
MVLPSLMNPGAVCRQTARLAITQLLNRSLVVFLKKVFVSGA